MIVKSAVEGMPMREPIRPSGSLDSFSYDDTTPVIGREYYDVNIVEVFLNASNVEERLRDLAYIISSRGVVFFRQQDNLTNDLQKQLVQRLGEVSGKPKDSSLHIHPVMNNTGDVEISHIDSVQREEYLKHVEDYKANKSQYRAAEWHSDVQFERCPPDYTCLRLTKLPKNGGDTLWASGYEIYDRFSPAYQKFFETLTATFSGEGYAKMAAADPENVKLFQEPRGNPLNVQLKSVHPVVRTNPVTGWKSIFAIGPFPSRINELTPDESKELLAKFMDMIVKNHDLTVRYKWRSPNDFAIWDNRSVFHTPTFDYDGLGERYGHRAVGIGEEPYLDPYSRARTEDLDSTS
ncbi:putative alpha-ketoglutarate-dependent sulfonate dioxygenase [Pseudocercospora fuligena]|uniref:Putative alpha-ketoglutarate-dependent sulfonate dioxygenase n=1 Tax=Pseudocercospora fuligena TaxID=685502 RepID=A0A8H6REG5_9PEZI|nr:putative alpha-ketoglutarate-dependent sulfonate dioxygenase [Pseudocercospora fuligena]